MDNNQDRSKQKEATKNKRTPVPVYLYNAANHWTNAELDIVIWALERYVLMFSYCILKRDSLHSDEDIARFIPSTEASDVSRIFLSHKL